jgi:hypothetical protein
MEQGNRPDAVMDERAIQVNRADESFRHLVNLRGFCYACHFKFTDIGSIIFCVCLVHAQPQTSLATKFLMGEAVHRECLVDPGKVFIYNFLIRSGMVLRSMQPRKCVGITIPIQNCPRKYICGGVR